MASANRFAFTRKSLQAVEPPFSDRLYVYDTKQPGLALCVTSAGARTYYVYKKLDGKPLRHRLGRFDELSIENARKAAARAVAKIADGVNPLDAKREKRAEKTLRQLFDWYHEHYSNRRRGRGAARDQATWDHHLKHWGGRRLSAIKPADVQALHARIGDETGPAAANQAIGFLRGMLKRAIVNGWVATNAAVGVERFSQPSRRRFLSADELPKFLEAVDAEPRQTTRDFFRMLLFTGARRSNVASMRWDELDLPGGIWSIPGSKSKNAEAMTVHLPQPAIEILKRRKAGDNSGEWVFPGKGKAGHMTEPKHAMKRIIERSGLKDVRVHDLRRTFGSWQAASGASLLVIGKSLGHKNPSSTAVYARLDLDPVRAAVDVAVAAMLATSAPKGGGKD